MTRPGAPPAQNPTDLPVTTLTWGTYLDRLEASAAEAERALAAGEAFGWVDLALPGGTPTREQRERAGQLRERLEAVLGEAVRHRELIARGLSSLASSRPRTWAAGGVLGRELDVTG
jgi:hypothetical protein